MCVRVRMLVSEFIATQTPLRLLLAFRVADKSVYKLFVIQDI